MTAGFPQTDLVKGKKIMEGLKGHRRGSLSPPQALRFGMHSPFWKKELSHWLSGRKHREQSTVTLLL